MFYYLELIRKGDKRKKWLIMRTQEICYQQLMQLFHHYNDFNRRDDFRKPVLCYMPIDEGNDDHFKSSLKQTHFEEFLSIPEVLVAWGGQLLELTSELIKKLIICLIQKMLKKLLNS